LVFYHIHNPSTAAEINFIRSCPHSEWVMMVREPIQSCESWLRESIEKNNYRDAVMKISYMLNQINNPIFKTNRSVGIRLEDLKSDPEKTLPSICAWFGIDKEDCLHEMTVQGKKWWGNPASPDYDKDGMNAFGKISLNRKTGSIFSENDQFILRTLFYPFSVLFDYVKKDLDQFKIDLQIIRPMLDQIFDFEKIFLKELEIAPKNFIQSGSYLFLRSQLLECWNTLDKHHTYPNMIRPLKIN